jgi:hypothetical protein
MSDMRQRTEIWIDSNHYQVRPSDILPSSPTRRLMHARVEHNHFRWDRVGELSSKLSQGLQLRAQSIWSFSERDNSPAGIKHISLTPLTLESCGVMLRNA